MTSLADDLLKNKPIADLRVLIKQLNKDAEDKKTELRSMVGSQYHQFIQSADKITEMHDQSKILLTSLDQFWERNQDFVSQMQTFLHKDEQKTISAQNQDKIKVGKQGKVSIGGTSRIYLLKFRHSNLHVCVDITASHLWKDIGDCDVYTAAMRVIIASSIVANHGQGNLVGVNSSWLKAYISDAALQNIANLELPASTLLELKSCIFLSEVRFVLLAIFAH